MATITFSEKNKNLVLGFMSQSYEDYRTARILYHKGLFVPATFMANTAIEKVMKAHLMSRGVSYGRIHDVSVLHEKLLTAEPSFVGKMNPEFLKALFNIYRARYIGDQDVNFQFVIIFRKFIAELDFTYDYLATKINIARTSGVIKNMEYYSRSTDDKIIKSHNFVLGNLDKTTFIEVDDYVMEYVILPNFDTASKTYKGSGMLNDGVFEYDVKLTLDDLNRTIFPIVESD